MVSYQNFTIFTETDPNNHIALVGTNHVDATVTLAEDAYLYRDKGAGHFGDFEHLIDMKINDASADTSHVIAWGLSNDIDDIKGLRSGGKTVIHVTLIRVTPYAGIYLQESYATVSYWDRNLALALDTWYYLIVKKVGTALTCKIYSDAARTVLVDTLSLTLHGDWTFRYVWAVNTYNDGSAPQVDADIENLALQEEVAYTVTISESLGMSDSVVNRADFKQAISESMGMVDSATAGHGMHVTISDSLGIRDRLDSRKHKTKIDDLPDDTITGGA